MQRREFLKYGTLTVTGLALGGGAVPFVPLRRARADDGGVAGPSPPTSPFVQELPIAPLHQPVAPFATSCPTSGNTLFYNVHIQEQLHSFHPQLPDNLIWGYNGITPGPTFHARVGQPNVVRFFNDLPANHRGFGVPNTVVHRHGGFQASEDDGFPLDLFTPGTSRDFCWPNVSPGNDVRENEATLWYHDHLVDFTGPNVYKGLAGFFLMFDDVDSGDETDPNPAALRLPSGDFDIPLVFQDRAFDQNGQLIFNTFEHNGFLGDKFLVNGAIQPFLRVARRKYRFRFLDGSNARFYEFFLSSGQSFVQIASDDKLLPHPIVRKSIRMGMAERVDVVIDFSGYPIGQEVILQNRLQQNDGRGPSDEGLVSPGTPILKFIVTRDAADPSRVPDPLRPLPPILLDKVGAHRTFTFDNSDGGWVINDRFFDGNRAVAFPQLGVPEIWTLQNEGGEWSHPIHIHLESFQILSRNGQPPAAYEAGQKDTVVLGPDDEVKLYIQFRTFRGRYVFHCHNTEHEDMAMMARFDTT